MIINAISVTVAQNAESDGDSSSIISAQISTPIGIRKCSPAFTVGHVSGSTGLSTLMSAGRSGHFDATYTV